MDINKTKPPEKKWFGLKQEDCKLMGRKSKMLSMVSFKSRKKKKYRIAIIFTIPVIILSTWGTLVFRMDMYRRTQTNSYGRGRFCEYIRRYIIDSSEFFKIC